MSAVLPVPRSFVDEGVLRPLSERTIRVGGPFVSDVIAAASDLAERAFEVRLVHDEGASDVVVVSASVAAPAVQGVDPRPADRAGRSEDYGIRPTGDRLTITADSAEGVFRALLTLAASAGSELPALSVEDHPQYAWRGLNFDVVRHWFDVVEVRRVIDLLAVHRLNVLHLHLTDTQGWRFDVPGYPQIASTDRFTADDLAGLEEYARARFVVIVPEVDVPGHVPESLAALPNVQVETGAHPFLAYLDADAAGVIDLLTAAFRELAERFSSPYLHVGGDEAFGAPEEVYRRTVTAAIRIVRDLGRAPLGWQEAIRADALASSGSSTPDLVQLWIAERDRFDAEKAKQTIPEEFHALVDRAGDLFALSVKDPAAIGAAGVPAIISSSDPLYFDRRPREGSRDADQNETATRLGNPGYDATESTDVLDWEPREQVDIADHGIRIAGLEAALWCESVESFDDAAQLLLPRLGFFAQRAWGAAPRSTVLAAAAESTVVWERLGFANHHRSVALPVI